MTRYKLSEAEFKLWKCPEDERVVDEPRQVSSSRRGSWIVVNTEPINPKSDPPVAQIVDFTHFKYQKEKEARKQKTKSKISDVKGIRLSIRIGLHDMNIRDIMNDVCVDSDHQ